MFVCCERCVCCQVEVSATDWSLVQRSPTECGASLCVIKKACEWGGTGLLRALAQKQANKSLENSFQCNFVSMEIEDFWLHKYLSVDYLCTLYLWTYKIYHVFYCPFQVTQGTACVILTGPHSNYVP
jgi:hypothetical protein